MRLPKVCYEWCSIVVVVAVLSLAFSYFSTTVYTVHILLRDKWLKMRRCSTYTSSAAAATAAAHVKMWCCLCCCDCVYTVLFLWLGVFLSYKQNQKRKTVALSTSIQKSERGNGKNKPAIERDYGNHAAIYIAWKWNGFCVCVCAASHLSHSNGINAKWLCVHLVCLRLSLSLSLCVYSCSFAHQNFYQCYYYYNIKYN